MSIIPVTLGNIVGGALMTGAFLWFLYGRNDTLPTKTGQPLSGENKRLDTNGNGTNGQTVSTEDGRRRRNDSRV